MDARFAIAWAIKCRRWPDREAGGDLNMDLLRWVSPGLRLLREEYFNVQSCSRAAAQNLGQTSDDSIARLWLCRRRKTGFARISPSGHGTGVREGHQILPPLQPS